MGDTFQLHIQKFWEMYGNRTFYCQSLTSDIDSNKRKHTHIYTFSINKPCDALWYGWLLQGGSLVKRNNVSVSDIARVQCGQINRFSC